MSDEVSGDFSAEQPVESAPVEDSQEEVIEGDIGEAAPLEDGASEAEMKEAVQLIKQLKLKVDGEEFIEELPFEVTPEQAEYLKKELQMSKMSQKRAKEAAELKKKDVAREEQLFKFIQELKSSPENILKNLGVDPLDFATKVLEKEVELQELSPEQRRIMDLEKRLKEKEDYENQLKEEQKALERKAIEDRYATDMQKDLTEALDEFKLPNDPYIVDKMVAMMGVALNQKIDLSFKDLAPLVQEQRRNDIRNSVKTMSAEEILEILSEDAVKNIVLKKMPKSQPKKAPPTANSIKESGKIAEKDEVIKVRNKSMADFFKNLG